MSQGNLLTSLCPRVQTRLHHRLITSNSRILLHVRVHLRLAVEREEPFQQLKNLSHGGFWETSVCDIEEATFCTGSINLLCNGLSLRGCAVDIGNVNSRNGSEAGGLLGDLAVSCLGARVEVYIFTTVLLIAVSVCQRSRLRQRTSCPVVGVGALNTFDMLVLFREVRYSQARIKKQEATFPATGNKKTTLRSRSIMRLKNNSDNRSAPALGHENGPSSPSLVSHFNWPRAPLSSR